ncbi:MAG: nucleotidyl transferase AbiEii/AbiGii toxin family protein [Syntrophobacteraceae bacterium]
MLDRKLIERTAGAFLTDEYLVEKDWYVVHAIRAISALNYAGMEPVFSGGTSLSKGWGLIKRFSEDVDFKVTMPRGESGAQERKQRSAFREQVLSALGAVGFILITVKKGNESRFFSADLSYHSHFEAGPGLRPYIRIEMSFLKPVLKPINRSIQSMIAQFEKKLPEVSSFPCIDPIETAADKLSALAWRVCTRKRGAVGDDPTIVRHLHDLGALEVHVAGKAEFETLLWQIAGKDSGRGGESAPLDPAERFALMLDLLHNDREWEAEYDKFVLQVSFARPGDTITFAEAFAATKRLIALVYGEMSP